MDKKTGALASNTKHRWEKNYQTLVDHYPSLAFFLQIGDKQALYQSPSKKKRESILEDEIPKEIEVIYVYGIGRGEYYLSLKVWLEETGIRRLIFLEDQVDKMGDFLHASCAGDLLKHPQVEVVFRLPGSDLQKFLNEPMERFPTLHLSVFCDEEYQRSKHSLFKEMKRYLLTHSIVVHAFFQDGLHHSVFVKNTVENLDIWEHAFDGNGLINQFSGVPAIICGAGPSLSQDIPHLKKYQDSALIFGCGSAVSILSAHQVTPHFVVACDPSSEEFHRLSHGEFFETPFLYVSRLQPDIFSLTNSPFGYLHSLTGGPVEIWLEKKLGFEQCSLEEISHEGLSVTSLALQIATSYGCNPIIFLGIDLSLTDGQMYGEEVYVERIDDVGEMLFQTKDIHGLPISTLKKWVLEERALSSFIQNHPDIEFLYSGSRGLGITGAKIQPIHRLERFPQRDLRGLIQQLIALKSLPSCSVSPLKEEMSKQITSAIALVEEGIEVLEGAKKENISLKKTRFCLLQIELDELEIYPILLLPAYVPLKILFSWQYSQTESEFDEEGWTRFLWSHYLIILKQYLDMWKSHGR